jgi:signal transduction histidine kinase
MSCLKRILLLLAIFSCNSQLFAQVNFSGSNLVLGPHVEVARDNSNSISKDSVSSLHFERSFEATPNFGLTESTIWIRFTITNTTPSEKLYLELAYSMLDTCILYSPEGSPLPMQHVFESERFDQRTIKHHNIVFFLYLKEGQTGTYYMKIRGNEQILAPLLVWSEEGFIKSSLLQEIITGIYIGVLLVMILYNLFLFFSIKEKSYLYYVGYILFIALTQTTLSGYTFKLLWRNCPAFNNLAIILFPAISGCFAIFFFKNFLHTASKTPWLDRVLSLVLFTYTGAVIFRLLGMDMVSYRIIDLSGFIAVVTGFLIALKLTIAGYRPAKFFLLSWSIFLVGLILFVLRNLNVLPYNTFTNYTMQAGTAIEVIVLSLALADKINILKKEREASQAEALRITQENAMIIKEQNVLLEQKVEERTEELQKTNLELNETLTQLKDAQTQLIDSEKMASLGQLTAGIAHEINNPINFVSSNIKPLRRDIADLLEIVDSYEGLKEIDSLELLKQKIEDSEALKEDLDVDYLKEEMNTLLKGMEDGASRTVEIIRGLKNFSRIDESDANFINVNEGLESTLVILNNQMSNRIKLVKDLGGLPNINCYAGKLNQVFMNVISNSIDAVNEVDRSLRQPTIWVTTRQLDEGHITVSIKDNGSGMSPEVKAKIYDPFFTTKEVGKGTGLGLSIVFKIIEAHKGNIKVITQEGEGTEFVITLPISTT